MHCFTYTPPDESAHKNELDDKELESVMNDMFAEIQDSTPEEFAAVFDTSVANCDVPDTGTARTGARSKLKAVANTAYCLADKVGPDGARELESQMLKFNEWCSARLAADRSVSNNKRKYVPFSQESYDGTEKRVFNTKHM